MENKELQKNVDEIISTEQQRAIQEVQGMMLIAKRFPRDADKCLMKIKKACEPVYKPAPKPVGAFGAGGATLKQ